MPFSPRTSGFLALLLAAVGGAAGIASGEGEAPPVPDPAKTPANGPAPLKKTTPSLEILDRIKDDTEFTWEALFEFFGILKGMTDGEVRDLARPGVTWEDFIARSDSLRGSVVRVEGILRSIEEFPVPPNDQGIERIYRGEIYHYTRNQAFVFFTLASPGNIRFNQDKVAVEGMFLQRIPHPAPDGKEISAPLILARRIETRGGAVALPGGAGVETLPSPVVLSPLPKGPLYPSEETLKKIQDRKAYPEEAFWEFMEILRTAKDEDIHKEVEGRIRAEDFNLRPREMRGRYVRMKGILLNLIAYQDKNPDKILNLEGKPTFIFEGQMMDFTNRQFCYFKVLEAPPKFDRLKDPGEMDNPTMDTYGEAVAVEGMFFQLNEYLSKDRGWRYVPLVLGKRLVIRDSGPAKPFWAIYKMIGGWVLIFAIVLGAVVVGTRRAERAFAARLAEIRKDRPGPRNRPRTSNRRTTTENTGTAETAFTPAATLTGGGPAAQNPPPPHGPPATAAPTSPPADLPPAPPVADPFPPPI